MPLSNMDVGLVVNIVAQHHQRVRYGVIGAAISTRVGNPAAVPGSWGPATVASLNGFFGGMCPPASWVVGENGFPTGYGEPPGPPNPLYDLTWSVNTPLHETVQALLEWLDNNAPGWDGNLQS